MPMKKFVTAGMGMAVVAMLLLAAGEIRPVPAALPLSRAAIPVAPPENNATVTINIDNFSFGPMERTIAPATEVTWINKDDVPHTVVGVHHEFASPALDTDEKFSFTFREAGTYEYFCSVHPQMTAKIIVK